MLHFIRLSSQKHQFFDGTNFDQIRLKLKMPFSTWSWCCRSETQASLTEKDFIGLLLQHHPSYMSFRGVAELRTCIELFSELSSQSNYGLLRSNFHFHSSSYLLPKLVFLIRIKKQSIVVLFHRFTTIYFLKILYLIHHPNIYPIYWISTSSRHEAGIPFSCHSTILSLFYNFPFLAGPHLYHILPPTI